MNPMMMMAAAAAGLLLLMQRGQAAPAAQDKEKAPAPAPATQVVAPFETGGDDARDITELGPTGPVPAAIPVQPGDRKAITPRAEPVIKTTPIPAPAARRGPQIVAMTSQPTIR
jgi:hypothetical protein